MCMKNFVVFTALYLTLSLLSCEDSRNELKSPARDYIAYKSVGKQIPYETGMRWMKTYEQEKGIESRLIGAQNSISANNLEALMESVPDLVGFAFHYATDTYGGS